MAIGKIVEKVYYDINLVQNQSLVFVNRMNNAKSITMKGWNTSNPTYWSKYQIKETDMRQKTASFTSPQYLDLTTGLYTVLITSPYHEDFGGIILTVDYDKSTGLYEYQCQDFSRKYQSKFSLISKNNSYYNLLRLFLTQMGVSNGKGKVSSAKLENYSRQLSGLRPKLYYDQGIWENGIKFNPMTNVQQMIFRDISYIDAIRDLVFGTGAYIDVYFDKYGVLQIKPFSKNDWLQNGIYLTTPELASSKFKFDTTNIITGVVVNSEDRSKKGKYYSSEKLLRLDLSAFFGNLNASVDNPNKTTTSTSTKSTSNKKSTKTKTKEGTGITVFMNIDNIHSKSTDMKLMKDIGKYLKKRGYKIEIGGIGPGYHYSQINRVKKNGIYMCIYGGACAGTLKEHWSSNHYKSVLKKKNAKMVVAFLSPPSSNIHNLKWLPRAHDDDFSPSSFKGVNNPEKQLLNAGIGVVIGKNAKEIASKFPNFQTSDNKTKSKKSTKKSSTKSTPINTSTALYINNEMAEARNQLSDSIRDLLSLKLTLPLGNPLLKRLHTNMFLYTELPEEFMLENFSTIAEVLNSTYNRYVGYSLNRWYVETVTITNDGSKFDAEVELNPFPSSIKKYREGKNKFSEEYKSAVQSKTSSNTASSKNTSKSTKSSKNTTLKGGEGKTIDNLVKKIIGSETNELKKAKLIHEWLQKNVRYSYYECTKYNTPEKCYKNRGHLNCADTARLTASMMRSAGLKCYIVHRTYNGGHFWTIIEINGKKYASDQTGDGSAWNTVWAKSGRVKVSNGGSYSRKNGKVPDC